MSCTSRSRPSCWPRPEPGAAARSTARAWPSIRPSTPSSSSAGRAPIPSGCARPSCPSAPEAEPVRSVLRGLLRLGLLLLPVLLAEAEDTADEGEGQPQGVLVDDIEDVDGGLAELEAEDGPDESEDQTAEQVGDEEEREPHPRPPGDEVDQSAGDARAAGDQSHEEQGPVRDPLELIDALELSLVLREEPQHTVAPPAPGQPERPVEFRHADESGHDDQPARDLTGAGRGRGGADGGLRAVDELLYDGGVDEHPGPQRHEREVDERHADDDDQQQFVQPRGLAPPGFES